jgi:predicted NBD/HSP70 family sugar kinase
VTASATAAWTLCHTFLPQRILLGGGVMDDHFERFAPAMRERLATATQFTRTAVSVERAELGNDAGLVGAACLALRSSGAPATSDSASCPPTT